MNYHALQVLKHFTRVCKKEGINFVCSFQLPDQKFGIAQCGTRTVTTGHIGRLHQMAINTDPEWNKHSVEMWESIGADAGKLIAEPDKEPART